ncbi:MAG: ABATE domain-containing protein [Gemmatimonadota bacterium]|jgi:predicted RNA-binding Zn ribbon-like protein
MVSVKNFEERPQVGGRSSLDFINTEGGDRNGPPDWLESYEDIVEWSASEALLSAGEATALLTKAARIPEAANDVFERAIDLREGLFRIFHSIHADREPAERDLAILDRELSGALARLKLTPSENRFEWRFVGGEHELDRVLWPIVRDAADLLSSDVIERVEECDGDNCTWLFVDTSRNRSRRWCKMGDCGNRAKARRYYRRHKRDISTAP